MKTLQWAIATFFGVGYAPISGTAGSIVAALIWWLLPWDAAAQGIVCAATLFVGVWAADRLAAQIKDKDPSIVVIDEVLGMWLSVLGLPKNLIILGLGVAFFRIFDIIKPPPIRQLERLPGGWGIVLDDVAAGVLARIVVGLIAPFLLR